MRINPPGTPQRHSNQPEIHTFIGDTPQAANKSDLELAHDYGAVRAYQRSLGVAINTDDAHNDGLDIRKAHPRLQARWLASDSALSY